MTTTARTIICLLAVGVLLGLCPRTDAGLGDLGKAVNLGKKLVDEDKTKKEEPSEKGKSGDAKGAATPAGKAEAGNIVFSTSPIKPDKAEKLANAFKAGDSIYAVVYPKKSFEEMAEGSKSMFLEFKCSLDGKYASAGSYSVRLKGDAMQRKALVLDLSPEADKMTAYTDKCLVYKDEFEKYGKKAGPMKFTKFLSTLKPGKHTIKLVAYRYGDMAVGTFTITGEDYKTPCEKRFKELEESNTAGAAMPKSNMDDLKLEGQMYKALKNSKVKEAKDGEVLQIVIMDSGWNIERHKISGAVLGRHIRAMTAIQEKSGPCWMWQFTFRQDFIGNEFQPVKLDGIYERKKIPEANVKKETFE